MSIFILRGLVAVFLALVSMATWVPRIRIAGVAPDLLLALTLVPAITRGPAWGAWTGFGLGLLVAVEQPRVFGSESLALALAGIAVARLARSLDRHNPVVLVFLLFIASLIAESVRALFLAGGSPWQAILLWFRYGLPGAVYTALVVPALAWALQKVSGSDLMASPGRRSPNRS